MQKVINKLDRYQVRMMLSFFDIPLKDQPNLYKEAKILLTSCMRADRPRYDEIYKICVDQDATSDGDTPPTKVLPMFEASQIINKEIKALEESAIRIVSEKYLALSKELVKEIQNEATETINREAKKFNRIEIKVGNKKPKEIKGALPEEFKRLLQLASARLNILMVGPTGCGKTFISAKIAEALELDFSSQSCSAGVSESAFSGWLIPVGAGGKFVYVSSEFVRIYENGGVFLFDEMDASDANMLVFLNQALANDSFTIPQRHENPLIKKHKDFVAIAAANTGGGGADSMYHGRNSLDEATLDRFRVGTVLMDYSPTVEQSLFNEEILNWGLKIRSQISRHNLVRVLSTRTMIDAQKMQDQHGWTVDEFEQGYFASWSKEELLIIGRNV